MIAGCDYGATKLSGEKKAAFSCGDPILRSRCEIPEAGVRDGKKFRNCQLRVNPDIIAFSNVSFVYCQLSRNCGMRNDNFKIFKLKI